MNPTATRCPLPKSAVWRFLSLLFTETPSRRNTVSPKHRNTETPKHRNTSSVPLFPALRSGLRLLQGPSPQKQIPSTKITMKTLRHLLAAAIVIHTTVLLAAEPGPAAEGGKNIPFDQLGAEAQKQYTGDGIRITTTPNGARLQAAMQDLEAEATAQGLWLKSVTDEDAGKEVRFRVLAAEVGRVGSGAAARVLLPATGEVRATGEGVTFTRPGLVEEYSVSMDGVRQDFVVLERPAGAGDLSVRLGVDGARVEAADYGAKLTLHGNGREIAYSRLRVTDATGRELAARMEVSSASALAVRVEDAGASYPVRIDPTFSDARYMVTDKK